MEEEEYYDQDYNEEEEDEDEEITQEDAWPVISAYFEEKGLVRQQLDSFDEFIQNTMQEIVDEAADIEIRPESQIIPVTSPNSPRFIHSSHSVNDIQGSKRNKDFARRLLGLD
ncbi:UNVERIFIED_CONTAM: DNA-directed RNA polymerase II subunit RPB2 [Sesamum radiatum]|uniref:DNA-directed RNA polymerase n=1 Tax=Sesamum radiatum TaxID=300843 RepID=A0AAW2KG11_SESRA